MNDDKHKLHEEVETMIRQFSVGAHVAVEMLKDGQLSFDSWYEVAHLRNLTKPREPNPYYG